MYYSTENFSFSFLSSFKSVQNFNIYPRDKMIITRSNQETLKWLRQIDWQKMSGKTLTDEAMCFFGELQTKRPNTVKSKLAEFLKKEDQLRKCVLFKIMRERGGEGPRGRSPPSNFELKDITFGGFIDEKNFSFHCNICGTTLTGRNESEKHQDWSFLFIQITFCKGMSSSN